MLDIPRMNRIRLSARPIPQRAVAMGWIRPNYEWRLGKKVEIVFENAERLPDHPVIFAMNHTDRYNYFPFQYRLYRELGRYTATWVKGKYYEHWFVGSFMEATNNLPTVSRGYIITKDFELMLGRRPTSDEYAALRGMVDAAAAAEAESDVVRELERAGGFPRALLAVPREILGRRFDPQRERYAEAVNAVFATMMRRFVSLHEEAFAKDLDVIIFPEGTRSTVLTRGHVGIAEIALKYRRTIVPVGCNGSDLVYPGNSPVAKPGVVTYRFGEPITFDDMAPWHVDESFTPFDVRDEAKHRERFQGLVDHVMGRVAGLLDARHLAGAGESDGVRGSDRFI